MATTRNSQRILASILAAATLGAVGLTAGEASAATPPTKIYTLTKTERSRVCGKFVGTIIYSDGYSVDCSSGDVYY